MAMMDIADLEREAQVEQSRGVMEAEKQCRISLSADWPRAIPLNWHPGKGGRLSIIMLEPGKSVVQPLSKAQSWFGPFAVPLEYQTTSDERLRARLAKTWQNEKSRYLNRYDYDRRKKWQDGYDPIGPHRSPDVTVQILEADGSEGEPVRLYQLYKIGPFDALVDSFGSQESAEQVEARLRAENDSTASAYKAEVAAMRLQMAEMAGMLQGAVSVGAGK